MSAAAFEAFLARLYSDAAARARFLADPAAEARAAGLTETQCRELLAIDRAGLELAGRSFDAKRARAHPRATGLRATLLQSIRAWFR